MHNGLLDSHRALGVIIDRWNFRDRHIIFVARIEISDLGHYSYPDR
jgi:hypothetical protein